MFILIFGATMILSTTEFKIARLFIIYGVGTLGYLLALFLWEITRKEIGFTFLCAIQIVFEILVVSSLIHLTGGMNSPFTIFYAFSILSSAFVFQFAGAIAVATTSVLGYAAVLILQYYDFISDSGVTEVMAHEHAELVFFRGFIYICFLYALAFLSGFLSGKLKTKMGEFEEIFSKYKRIKLNTDNILQHMKSGLITLNQQGKIVFFNQAANEILQITETDTEDKYIQEILNEKRQSLLLDKLEKLLKYTKPVTDRSEIIVTSPEGYDIPLALVVSNLIEEDEPNGLIAVFEDITLIKSNEKKLREIEKMAAIGELSTSLAHEIRNPLASIRGSAEVLSTESGTSSESEKLMHLIMKETDRLSRVLGDFLEFARIGEEPNKEAWFTKIDLNNLVSDVLSTLKRDPAFHKDIILSNKLDSTKIHIKGREDYVKNIFMNVLLNAVEAIGKNEGKIEIRLAEERPHLFGEGTMIGIAVSDTGHGITPNDKKQIFKPFYSTKPKGTGLGLPIAQRIVNQLKGYIEIEDNKPHGVVVTVYLVKESG